MPLTAGTKLGPYQIESPIGSGGMGEVYRARDPRLERDVAIKILPSEFSGNTERLRRFEQEARAAAAINHPNILAVYDIGVEPGPDSAPGSSGAPYIVSELLEGETLRERLPGARGTGGARVSARDATDARSGATALDAGGLPVRKAIDYGVQIARGLAAAHERNIVHRDLKPENIFVTADGRVKILDFGLAKLTEREPAQAAAASAMPTMPPDTLPGVVLGTIGYMSPEQVRGLAADHRADIFSFGAILYEMLSGRRAFLGETAADTMTAILKEDPPDLPTADRHMPPALPRIVDRCLEKNPAARFQSAGDLAFALEALSADSGATQALAGDVGMARKRDRLAWTLVAVLSAALVAAVGWAAVAQFWRAPVETRAIRFTISAPDGWSLPLTVTFGTQVSGLAPLAVSPDGRRLAFIGRGEGEKDMLWVRPLDTLTARMLPGTDGVSAPFWSPDSRFLGFFAGGKLKKIDVSGGPPMPICDVGNGSGGTWSREGVILFADSGLSQPGLSVIRRVPAAGGVPTAATAVEQGDSDNQSRPVFLPDGRHFLFGEEGQGRGIYLASLDSPGRTKMLDADSPQALYSQGHVIFLRDATLMAQPFDVGKAAFTGDAFPVAEEIQRQMGGVSGLGPVSSSGLFSVSEGGVLVYRTGSAQVTGTQLVWFDRAGQRHGALGDRANYADVQLSPDGKRASVTIIDPSGAARASRRGSQGSQGSQGVSPNDIWLFDVTRGIRTRFTTDPAVDISAIWSPDGARIVFGSSRAGSLDLYERPSNESTSEKVLLAGDGAERPLSWSSDGKHLLYVSTPAGEGGRRGRAPTSGDGQTQFWALPLVGAGKPFRFLQEARSLVASVQFSPDSRWVAYVSSDSGQNEVYVTPFPGPGGKTRVSTAGGSQPRWRRDGKEIFYLAPSPDVRIMSAAVTAKSSSFEVGAVQPLFAVQPSGPRSAYDVSADGQRFLVSTRGTEAPTTPTPITVVVNWRAGL